LPLEAGGAVVGLMPDFPYIQATIAMQPGDLLIGFTDGISEAMNSAEEDYGEARLIAAAQTCDNLSAAEIISRLVADVDTFVAGAKQHDDMTLVVVRVVG
jgi:sigma-B regulation protein RsbU (phosphoserine phosphatase)